MPEPRPNIVMVMVDDASEHMFVDLPHVYEDIVLEGATIPNFLFNQPLCARSRATFLRGQYAHNTRIDGNHWANKSALKHFQEYGLEDSNLATWFQDAGYRTALVGKYMNGYGEDPALEDLYYTPPGWNFFFAVGHDAAGGFNYDAWYDADGHGGGAGQIVHYEDDLDTDYLTDVLKARALEFLDNALDGEDPPPFLLIVTPKAPHHPAEYHPSYGDEYPSVMYPTGGSFNETDVSDKADYIRFQALLSNVEIGNIHDNYRDKLRCMRSVDDLVHALVVRLGAVMENTYFIFCSDHGFHSGEHRLGHENSNGGKNTPYEEDIRVPLYIRHPDIPAESTVEQLVGNVDIAATLCEMANVPPDGVTLDGRSFLPLVRGEPVPSWRNYYLLSRGRGDPWYGLRGASPAIKFVEFDYEQTTPVVGEYYDLSEDPPEMDNGYLGLESGDLSALQDRLADLRDCEGSSCRSAEE